MMVYKEEGEWKLWIGYPFDFAIALRTGTCKGECSNVQTPSLEHQQTDTVTRIHRDRTPAFIPDGDTQARFDPGAFYASVYQYVNFHVEKSGAVIPMPVVQFPVASNQLKRFSLPFRFW